MKKKYFMSMLSILMMAMLCVNLVSCSKDDNGGGSLAYDANHPLVGSWYVSAMDGVWKNEQLLLLYSNNVFKMQQRYSGGDGYEDFITEGTYEYDEGDGVIYIRVTKTNDPDNMVGATFELDVISLTKTRLVVENYDYESEDYVQTSYNRVEGKVSL